MKNFTKILSLILCIAMTVCFFTACGEDKEPSKTTGKAEPSHTVVISVEEYGDITLDLYDAYAPETVANFVKLANEGFYEGTIFHRVYQGFMIQGGGYTLADTVNTKDCATIKGEFSSNGFEKNTITHKRGIISMARTNDPNSASSQFFICDADSTFLDGNYAAFGVVTKGMDVVDKIAACPVSVGPSGEESLPINYPVISSVKVVKGK